MKRYIFAGLLVFLLSALAIAPAGLVSRGIAIATGEIALIEPRGTIWSGQGLLLIGGQQFGTLSWRLSPISLIVLNPGVTWQLRHNEADLSGTIQGLKVLRFNADGEMDLNLLRPLFDRYDLRIPGTATFNQVKATLNLTERVLQDLSGQIRWSGGRIRYILSGLLSESNLPELRAELSSPDNVPTADVYTDSEPVRLMQAQLQPDGFIKIGISKLFTKVLNRPWPGSDPDHAIVLVVEEQLL